MSSAAISHSLIELQIWLIALGTKGPVRNRDANSVDTVVPHLGKVVLYDPFGIVFAQDGLKLLSGQGLGESPFIVTLGA